MSETLEQPKKVKFPRELAIAVARELCHVLIPAALPKRLIIGGSLRRMRPEVGDVEVIYQARMSQEPDPEALFGDEVRTVNLMERAIAALVAQGILAQRLSKTGRP